MSGKIALDTSAAIALMRGTPSAVQYIADAAEVLVSSIVVGELCYGAELSAKREQNLRHVAQLESIRRVLVCDSGTGRIFGKIKSVLHQRGQMIPENDLWIAAHAIQHSAKLVTLDAHFSVVDGLQTESC